jgi:hypothetical protein
VVEVEDITEVLNMEFVEGTLFKSLCKLRQNLGKPVSKEKYEAEKIKYYGDRVLTKTQRRTPHEEFEVCYINISDPKIQ